MPLIVSSVSPVQNIITTSSMGPFVVSPVLTISPNAKDYIKETLKSPPITITTSPLSPLSPYKTTINFTYAKPLISTTNESYENNPDLHRRQIKYYRYYTLDNWLYDDLRHILSYFTYKNGKVHLIKKLKDYKEKSSKNDSESAIEAKVDYIGEHFLTTELVAKLLFKYVKETKTSWFNLKKNEYFLKQLFEKHLIRKIKEAI